MVPVPGTRKTLPARLHAALGPFFEQENIDVTRLGLAPELELPAGLH
jgi:hypothetical protein